MNGVNVHGDRSCMNSPQTIDAPYTYYLLFMLFMKERKDRMQEPIDAVLKNTTDQGGMTRRFLILAAATCWCCLSELPDPACFPGEPCSAVEAGR